VHIIIAYKTLKSSRSKEVLQDNFRLERGKGTEQPCMDPVGGTRVNSLDEKKMLHSTTEKGELKTWRKDDGLKIRITSNLANLSVHGKGYAKTRSLSCQGCLSRKERSKN